MPSLTQIVGKAVVVCGISLFSLQAPELFAQGALTPPGPPAPTMKSLDQIQPRTPISSAPYTISNAGSYYFTTNITCGLANVNAITVASGNVVIDLNGFALLSTASNTYSGIYVQGTQTNVIIRNGTVNGWGASGIDAYSYGPSANLQLDHIVSANNAHYGLGVGSGAEIRNCSCMNNGWGGLINNGTTSVIGCSITFNTNSGAAGILLEGDLLIRDTQIYRNTYGLVAYGNRCDMHNCQVISNLNDGIYYYAYNLGSNVAASASIFTDCSIIGNGANGFNITGGTNNLGNGGSPMLISQCVVAANGLSGIFLNLCPACRVLNCIVAGNYLDGIYVGADNSFISGNTLSGNNTSNNTNYAGIRIISNQSRFEDNHFNNNGYAGFAIKGGAGNIVVKNTFGDAFYFGNTNNYIGPVGFATNATSPWANLFD